MYKDWRKVKPQKYPPPKVAAVDVDGTLLHKSQINLELVEWCRSKKCEGYTLILWSARGEAYARNVADQAGISDLFDSIISKPGYIVDDQGWGWTKYTRVVPVPDFQ